MRKQFKAAHTLCSWLIAGVALAGTMLGCQSGASHGEYLKHDEPLAAARFRLAQRVSADGSIPPNALMTAKAQRDALLENPQDGAGISPDSWVSVGPGNIGGRIRPIIIHPDDSNQIWIGSASGGIWKTDDGGVVWEPQDDFMPSLAVGCMVMHPTDPDILYAGTGEGFFDIEGGSSNTAAVQGAGIFVTNDGGATWSQMPSTANPDFYWVNRMAIDPNDPRIVFAATGSGIWRSTDRGTTWVNTLDENVLDLRMDPNNPSHLIASGDHHHAGPWYSIDSGMTWTESTGIGPVDRVELAYAPGDPNVVYGAASDNNRIRVWRSDNGGVSFTLRTNGSGISTWSAYNNTIWVDPTNSDFILLGGVYLYSSSDGGVTLSRRFNSVHADQHGIVNETGFNGTTNKRVYFATDGGIYRTDDAYGSSATALNTNLAITQFYGAAINDTSGVILGGTQDNGTLRYAGNANGWTSTFGGDGGYCAADPTDPDYFYGEVQRARIFRSTNGGQSASYIYSGITEAATLNTNFIPFFTLDPNDENRMLVCCRQLWRSNSVKSSNRNWTSIKPPLDNSPHRGKRLSQDHFAENDPINISTVAIKEGDSDLIFVGHNNGQVWYTTNGTDAQPSWTRLDELGSQPLPDRWISTIVTVADRVYVAFMGWEPDNLWAANAPYNQWEPVGNSGDWPLPSAPVSALAVSPYYDAWLYAGTDIGIFTSTDGGTSWSPATQGPGTVPVEQLIWRNPDTLMAVTHGRGIFLADVSLNIELADPDPGIAGEVNSFRVTNASSFGQVYYVYSRQAGSTFVSRCGINVDMAAPVLAGSAEADADGVAVLTMNVPEGARGQRVLIQALDRKTCRLSNLVTYRFR